MTTILLISSILLIFISAVIFYFIKEKKAKQTRQGYGLQWLALMREFVADVQRHRGLSSAFLKGDKSVQSDLNQIKHGIAKHIANISEVNSSILEDENWIGIVEHWQRLSVRYSELELTNSLKQHGNVINNTLFLVEEIADKCDLLTLKNVDKYGFDFVWKDLLESIEFMGQLRALGTGIAASKNCSSVERIRLNYLKDKISSVVERLGEYVEQRPQDKQIISSYIQTVENEFIQKQYFTVSSQEYFKIATQAIDTVYSEYDKILQNISPA